MIQRTPRLPFSLKICGIEELPQVMVRFRPTHILSVRDPADDRLEFDAHITVLHLAFHDIHAPTGMVGQLLARRGDDEFPNIDHADAILRFGRELPNAARVLVHCWAGYSRSPAAAFLIAAQQMPGDERRAYDLIRALRPQSRPNRMLVTYGDKVLGANGRMVACL